MFRAVKMNFMILIVVTDFQTQDNVGFESYNVLNEPFNPKLFRSSRRTKQTKNDFRAEKRKHTYTCVFKIKFSN